MIQRNNNTYAAAAKLSRATGKAAIAHSAAAKKLLIAVQPHGGTGVSHDDLRDKLAGVGVENAVFLDGSDSVLLQVDGVLHVRPAKAKDQTNSVGIGFRT